jgi:hypothetical protein
MTEKPNCSTCDKDCEGLLVGKDHMACLDHPGAREWLMAPVIKELERLSKQNVGTQYRYALEEAIALIRDGVKYE